MCNLRNDANRKTSSLPLYDKNLSRTRLDEKTRRNVVFEPRRNRAVNLAEYLRNIRVQSLASKSPQVRDRRV